MAGGAEPDWYEVLGVDPGVSDAEIGRAFRGLVRQVHPDAGLEASPGRFGEVARAYEVLRDPGRRADYDRARSGIPGGGIRIPVRRWATGASGASGVDPSPSEDPAAALPAVDVWVSVADSVTGTTVKVQLPKAVVCGECSGSERRSGGTCAACGGEGHHRRKSGSITINRICPECGGSGARPTQPCRACDGKGWKREARELSVRVPPGVADGTKLRLRTSSGQAAGFARVRLQADRWFAREGPDLVLRLPVSMAEAALGTVVAASLPDGPAEVKVPPGTRSGQRLRLAGRGVAGSPPGDLVVAVEVVIPEAPSDAERAALEALAAASLDPRPGWPARPDASASGGRGPEHKTRQPDNERSNVHVHDAL